MTSIGKTVIAAAAAGAVTLASAAPAFAQAPWRGNDRGDRGGVSAGEVIAGALIIGGIAAVASSNNRSGGRYGNRYDHNYRWGSPRQAVEQCVRAAERTASGQSWRGRADVTDIRQIRELRNGYEVKGRIAVNTRGRDWRRGDGNYGRGWNGDYRGWNNNLRGYDSGSFTCRTDRGRVANVKFKNIRGL